MHAWESLYANSALLRTLVGFVHIAGLLTGGGCAIVADRAPLRAFRRGADRTMELATIRTAHRVVIAGLTLVTISGALLLAADLDTYLHSRVFWTQMALVGLLLANGAALRAFAAGAAVDDARWRQLAFADARVPVRQGFRRLARRVRQTVKAAPGLGQKRLSDCGTLAYAAACPASA